MVLMPLGGVIWYLWERAEDKFLSNAGFTVRSESTAETGLLLGGLAQLAGSTAGSDADVLYAFIRSQDVVQEIDSRINLRKHYAQHYDTDPIFSLKPDASIEDLTDFWARVVGVSYDSGTGLIDLTVSAFDPEYAQRIARSVLLASQVMIIQINEQARDDAMRYALEDLDEAVERLKDARQAVTEFRTRTQIIDPATPREKGITRQPCPP